MEIDNALIKMTDIIGIDKMINRNTAMIRQIVVCMHNDELKKSARYQDPKHLIRFGEKIYSQNEEDGIIK